MAEPNRGISEERKVAYYAGNAVSLLGLLLFLSNFFGGISEARAIGGIVLLVVGRIISTIGAKGLAGSGVILDPEQAREDVEPWSRMTGGVVKDVLDEVGLDPSKITSGDNDADNDADNELTFDEKLRRLHALHQEGILDAEEYERAKRDILDEA